MPFPLKKTNRVSAVLIFLAQKVIIAVIIRYVQLNIIGKIIPKPKNIFKFILERHVVDSY
jgi:hypothetical protein